MLEGEPWVRGSVGAEAPGRPPGPRPRSARAPQRVPPPSWSEQCECAREPGGGSGGGVETGVGWGVRAAGGSAMHKHQHCCKCPECYEVTRLAALRRLEPPSYGDWQVPDPYGPGGGNGASAGYGGYSSQTLPSQAGATPTPRTKAKLIPTGRDVGPVPPKPVPGKSTPKLNGSGPSWWPECTCTGRDWYEQVWARGGGAGGRGRGEIGGGATQRGCGVGGLEAWSAAGVPGAPSQQTLSPSTAAGPREMVGNVCFSVCVCLGVSIWRGLGGAVCQEVKVWRRGTFSCVGGLGSSRYGG